MQDLQWLANFGFAAIVAGWLLLRFERTVQQMTAQMHTMTKQIWLNTVVLAKIAGQSLDEIEKAFCVEEERQKNL